MMAAMTVEAQAAPELPRLVVHILVDQLRTDYLEAFAPLYGEGGFRRLMSEARYYTDTQMPFRGPDRASAAACTSTGTTPFVNGIPGQTWLSRETLQPVFCVDDARYKGVQTDERTSPTHLLTTTVADELKLATAKRAIVVSIAPERDMAVLLAGHLADGIYWLNDNTGAWCSTTCYGTPPTWAFAYDRLSPLSSRLKDIEWEPVYDGAYESFHYFHANPEATAKAFSHRFKGDRRVRQFKSSALVNEEVQRLIDRCIEATTIGHDAVPDMLCVGLYAGTYDGQTVVTAPAELQDTYVRLDSTLAHIIYKVEKTYGRNAAMFVVSSTGYAETDASTYNYSQLGLATGTFSMERASLLLNMYLSAIFGQAQYVTTSRGSNIYLDAKLIEQRQLRLTDVLSRSKEFLAQMAGVRDVFAATDLTLAAGGTDAEATNPASLTAVRNAWHAARSGDIVIDIQPGWTVTPQNSNDYVASGHAHIPFPLFFLGPDTRSQRVTGTIPATVIAPTLASSLRIRGPNGSTVPPLPLSNNP